MITVLHRGGYAQMITILHRGGGSLGTPKSDYVICARPLTQFLIFLKIPLATHLRHFQHTFFIRKQLFKSPPGWYAQWVQIQMEDGEQYRCPINAWIFHGLVGKK